MNKSILIKLSLTAVIFLSIGFFVGMEYKSYQIRSAIDQVFNDDSEVAEEQDSQEQTAMEQIKEDGQRIIDKALGEKVAFATMDITAKEVEEKTILDGGFGTPPVAKQDSKFVIITLEITNTTKAEFDFEDDLLLVDNKGREFTPYDDTIGNIDNYLAWRTLKPGVPESGYVVYEIPNDAISYSFVIGKSGTEVNYKIKLK